MAVIKAVIWDLDGVILESEKFHIAAETETLKKYGVNIKKALAMKYFGIRTREYFRDIRKKFHLGFPLKKIIIYHQRKLVNYYREIMPLTPNATETLKLVNKKYSQGLATSTMRELVMVALNKYHLNQYFNVIICANDVNRGKPYPDIFLKTAQKLKVKPAECIVIEDSQAGFEAAKKAGMLVIARKAIHNNHQSFSKADFLIKDLSEIPKIVDRLIQ